MRDVLANVGRYVSRLVHSNGIFIRVKTKEFFNSKATFWTQVKHFYDQKFFLILNKKKN